MKFGLFLTLNAILLVRPEELFPAIAGLRLYLIAILLCTLVSLPDLLRVLSPDFLRVRPISVCVLLYFASTIVSLCVVGRSTEALFDSGPEFAKVILYYFLLLVVIDAERFRAFVAALVLLVVVLTAIALAQRFEITTFPNIIPVMQREYDAATGEEYWIPRLVSSGIFNDPNDLCLVLGFGIVACIYLTTTGSAAGHLLWLLPLPLFFFAVMETHSRGGLLGVLAGMAAYAYARFGGPKVLPFAAAGAVAALALVGGRQGNMAGGGTAHDRLMMWASGLGDLFGRPFYIPTGLGDGWFVDANGLVAHNSFVQAYVEQGLFGGGAFLGAFALGAWMIDRLGRGIPAPSWTIEARPFAFAAVCGYGMGCYSLTRNCVVPTYLILGLVSAVLEPSVEVLPEAYHVGGRWFARSVLFAVVGLVVMKYATQLLGMAGV